MRKWMSLALGILVLSACNNATGKGNNKARISGTIRSANEVVVNEMDFAEFKPVDTIALENDAFEVELDVEEADFYTLIFDNQSRVTLYVNPGDEIELDGTIVEELIDYSVSGSKESEKLQWLNTLNIDMVTLIQELNGRIEGAQETPEFDSILAAAQGEFEVKMEEQSAQVRRFVRENMSHPSVIFGLFHGIGGQSVLNPSDDFSLFDSVQVALETSYPGRSFTAFITDQVNLFRGSAVGADAPDFSMPGVDGVEHKVSEYFGNYLLIDFWASWCRPCRAENPNIVAAYNKYHERGFDVLGISLDGLPQQSDPKALWLEAIEADGLAWDHLSDLQGWQTVARSSYNFESIPFSVLVSPEGKIIAKNLRGPKLEEKLQELLGE